MARRNTKQLLNCGLELFLETSNKSTDLNDKKTKETIRGVVVGLAGFLPNSTENASLGVIKLKGKIAYNPKSDRYTIDIYPTDGRFEFKYLNFGNFFNPEGDRPKFFPSATFFPTYLDLYGRNTDLRLHHGPRKAKGKQNE